MLRLALGLGLMALPVAADEIDLGAPKDAERTTYQIHESDNYALPIGPVGRIGEMLERVKGRSVWSSYRVETVVGLQDVLAGYRARLEAEGFEPVFECWSMDCGGFDFRFGVTVLPAPFMRMDVQAFGQLSAMRAEPEAYASVLVSAVQGVTYVQTVAVTPADTKAAITAAPATRAEVAAEAEVTPGDARELSDILRANGHVPIEGLAFEPGGTALSADSDPALEALALILTRDAELNVVIVGHSDNEGTLDANIDLSQRRAEAVRVALIRRGVPEKQLEARGVGYLAPMTSNTTEEGRQANRRVELVLR